MQWATMETETEKTPDILSILNHPKKPRISYYVAFKGHIDIEFGFIFCHVLRQFLS